MEYVQPFSIKEGEVVHLKPSAPKKGVLELAVIEGGPVYLHRGRVSPESAKSSAELGGNLEFDLAANSAAHSYMTIEGDIGMLSVFSPKNTIGFLRFVEC